VGIDWTHQLAEQLDRHWRRQLRPRYDGLTDAEYFWEPVANTWNIRPRGHGRAAIAAGGGDFIIDYAYPEPTPAPVTTIAWRLAHLIVSVFGTRVADHFGGPPVDDLAFNYAGTAAQALRQLDDVYAAWLAGVKSLGEAGLARPCGPAEGPLAEYPMATLVLHINREALHHGAEIALLRDLYANRLPISRRPASRPGGSIYSCPASGDRTATGKSPEQRHERALAGGDQSLACVARPSLPAVVYLPGGFAGCGWSGPICRLRGRYLAEAVEHDRRDPGDSIGVRFLRAGVDLHGYHQRNVAGVDVAAQVPVRLRLVSQAGDRLADRLARFKQGRVGLDTCVQAWFHG
jgi:hypothetical protein